MNAANLENSFTHKVLRAARRIVMPIAAYPGLALTGAKVGDIVSDPAAQVEAQLALNGRYGTGFVMSAMDLSVEAEAFGCRIQSSPNEIPSVIGNLVEDMESAKRLRVPTPGDGRTGVYLETVRRLRQTPGNPFVLGGCIGPFSLAARLTGVREAMERVVTDPGLMHVLLAKSASFLATYVRAFARAGAHGILMAEPAAGLLSPRMLAEFSSAYIKPIAEASGADGLALVLHNCAAKLVHLPALLDLGLVGYHFGAPMDIVAALAKVPPGVVLCGNLDPAAVFCQSTPGQVRSKTAELIAATKGHPNFVLSSGCDLPPGTKLQNLDAFFEAAGIQAR